MFLIFKKNKRIININLLLIFFLSYITFILYNKYYIYEYNASFRNW